MVPELTNTAKTAASIAPYPKVRCRCVMGSLRSLRLDVTFAVTGQIMTSGIFHTIKEFNKATGFTIDLLWKTNDEMAC
jgi:hypothetical protein